jgi:D-alanyl-D-alanine carboxypeptidase
MNPRWHPSCPSTAAVTACEEPCNGGGVRRRIPTWRIGYPVAAIVLLAGCSPAAQSPAPTTNSVGSRSAGSTAPPTRSAPPSPAAVTAPTSPAQVPAMEATRAPPPDSTELADAAELPDPAEVPDPTGLPDPAGLPEATTAATPTPGTAAGFTGTISSIDPATTARMGTSWHPGCPVPLSDLRYLTLTYRGFDGADHPGELMVAATVADDVVAIFNRLYDAGYPIASMRLVDDFGGDDNASMSANNTSAFNCRPVTGGGGFSEHSYGTAIDLNPVQNPYLSGSLVLPQEGRQYLDRHRAPGVIQPGDDVVTAFADHGFSWGGSWSGPIDYQHFSVSGR